MNADNFCTYLLLEGGNQEENCRVRSAIGYQTRLKGLLSISCDQGPEEKKKKEKKDKLYFNDSFFLWEKQKNC